MPPFFPLVLRAKLADWLASKGRTLKRPPTASALPQAVSRPAPAKPLPKPEAVAIAGPNPETEPVTQQASGLEVQLENRPESDPKGAPGTAPRSSSDILNTTLDLLENSEMDLPVDPETRMDDVRAVSRHHLKPLMKLYGKGQTWPAEALASACRRGAN